MDFKKYKIKDIGEVVGGATPLTKDSDNYDGDISWITPNDLSNYKDVYINRGERNITAKGLKEIGNKLLPKGTVLFSSRAPIGYVAIANQELCTNQGFKSVIPNYELVTSEYLYYTLGFYKSFIEKQGSGTTFMEVSGATMENIELPIPALEEQRRISDTLIKIDKKIALNKRMNAELEAMAKQLYDYWFVQFDFPDENGNPYKSSGGKMVYNPTLKREIPEHWEVKRLSMLMEYSGGSQPPASEFISEKKDGYIRFVQIRDYYTDSHLTYIPVSNKNKICNETDIMIARYGASLGRICYGLAGAYNVALAKVFPKKQVYKEFLRTYLKSNTFYDKINTIGTRCAQAGFNSEDVQNIEIVMPRDETIIENFSLIMEHFFCSELKNNKQNKYLTHLRDSLLPMLMNGQVTVE